MTNARRLYKKARAASDSYKGPSLEFWSLTHNEGEITVDKREKEISNYEITTIYGKLQGNYHMLHREAAFQNSASIVVQKTSLL